jgi:hypothetical protein
MTAKEAALPPLTEPITELTLEMRGLYLLTTRDSGYEIDTQSAAKVDEPTPAMFFRRNETGGQCRSDRRSSVAPERRRDRSAIS